jgi:hypothetical protein
MLHRDGPASRARQVNRPSVDMTPPQTLHPIAA